MDFAEVVRQHIVAAILKRMRFPRHKRLARHRKKRFVLSDLQLLTKIGTGQNGIDLFDRRIAFHIQQVIKRGMGQFIGRQREARKKGEIEINFLVVKRELVQVSHPRNIEIVMMGRQT